MPGTWEEACLKYPTGALLFKKHCYLKFSQLSSDEHYVTSQELHSQWMESQACLTPQGSPCGKDSWKCLRDIEKEVQAGFLPRHPEVNPKFQCQLVLPINRIQALSRDLTTPAGSENGTHAPTCYPDACSGGDARGLLTRWPEGRISHETAWMITSWALGS